MTITSHIYIGLSAWAQNHAYSVGDRISNDTAPAKAYKCITAGTSQNVSGQGPKGTSSNITDGTAHWQYISGIDYTSFQSWWNGIGTPTDDIVGSIGFTGSAITTSAGTQFLSAGALTVGSFTITLKAAPGDSARDKNGSGAHAFRTDCLNLTLPSTYAGFPMNYIDISCANVIFEGLQFKDPLSTSLCSIINTNSGASGFILRDCILDGYGPDGGSIAGFGDSATLYNNLFVDRTGSTSTAQTVGTSVMGVAVNGANNTFVAPNGYTGTGWQNNTTVLSTIKNSVFIGYTQPAANVTANSLTVSNSAFDVSNSWMAPFSVTNGSGNLFSITPSNNFVSTTTDFNLKSGSVLLNAGATDTTDIPSADDFFYRHRPLGTSWDIGSVEYLPASVVQVPTLRVVATAVRAYAASATCTLTSLSASGSVSAIAPATCLQYITGIDCDAFAYLTKIVTAAIAVPTLRVVSNARMENRASAAPTITALSAVVATQLVTGAAATLTLSVISDTSTAGQSNLATVQSNLGTMSCAAFGPNQVSGIGTIQIHAAATGTIPNACSARATLSGLTNAPLLFGQEDLAHAANTISITSNPVVNPSLGGGTISIGVASIAVLQEDLASATDYVTGISVNALATLDEIVTGALTLSSLSAIVTGQQETLTSGVQTNLIVSANVVAGGETFASGLGEFEWSANVQAGQEQFSNGMADAIFVTAVATGLEEVLVSAAPHVPTLRSSVSAVQLESITALASLSLHSVVSVIQQALAAGVASMQIGAAVVAGQSDLANGTATIAPPTASGIFGQEDRANAASVLTTLTASAQVGQGNALLGTGTISIAASAQVANPLAVSGVATIAIAAQAVAGQEVMATAASLVTSLSDFARSTLEVGATGIATIGGVSGAGTVVLSTTATAAINLPTVTAAGVAYRGWVGTAMATVATLSASANVQLTNGVTGASTITLNAAATADHEFIATGLSTLAIGAQGIAFTGQLVAGLANVPTLRLTANAFIADTATGYNSILLSAFGAANLSNLWHASPTINITARGNVYPAPPIIKEGEEIVYVAADDRIVYVDE